MKYILPTLMIFLNAIGLRGQNITAAEYFFDADPGPGLGTPISISADDTLSFSAAISTTSLSSGFHFLAIRARYSTGIWSLFEQRGFYISLPNPGAMANIVTAEYFFDTDPGIGNGTSLPIGPSGSSVMFTAMIPQSLATGFHYLAIRVKDLSGKWGLYEQRGFYLYPAPVSMTNIVGAEYFFDADPGIGNGTPIAIGPSGAMVSFTAMTPANIAGGFHYLVIRVKDQSGKWSLFEQRTFYISPTPVSMPQINGAEYAWDIDPGPGLGNVVSIDTPGDTIQTTIQIPIDENAALGQHFYLNRVRDTNGKWSHFTYDTVTIAINGPADITVNAAPGSCSAIVNNLTPEVMNSEPYHYTLSGATTGSGNGSASGLSFNTGVTTLTYTLDNFPTAFVSSTITVSDAEFPTITCPANITAGSDMGICGAVINFSVPINDNCPGAVLTLVSGLASGSVFPAGVTTEIFRVTDASGNSTTCSFTVMVTDDDPPTITCPANLTVNTNPGDCIAAPVTLGSPVVNDNCGIASTTNNGLADYPVGVTNVTWTITDVNGFTSTCIQTVTVVDNQNPVVTCPPNITMNADPGGCTKSITYSASATDNCAISGIAYNPPSGTSFSVGTTIVTVTATDVNGGIGTCSFTVTIVDTEDPVITCPANINQNTNPGQCIATVSFNATATDNCGTPSVTYIPNSGSSFPIGTTMVTATATDAGGRTSSCTFTVTVTDNQPPSLACPANLTINAASGLCSASNVALGTPTVSDNCGIASTTNNGLTTYPVGVTQVTWTATDIYGLISTCIQTVTVVDNQNPVITCPANITLNADPGQCSKTTTYVATATDNCGIAGINYNPTSGSSFPIGSTLVTVTATDVNGHTGTCTFTVTITENVAPMITCPNDIYINTGPGICSSVVTYAVSFSDNCPGAVLMQTAGLSSGSSFPAGITINTFVATDASGNTATCQFIVNIIPSGEIPGNGIDDDCDGMIDELPQKAGINTTQPAAMLHVELGDVLFTGPVTLPVTPANPPASGAGTRLMWYPDKGAFRAGSVTANAWDKDSTGIFSIAMGYDAKAIGENTGSLGIASRVTGSSSLAIGNYPNVTGDSSLAIGNGYILNDKSVIFGNYNYVVSHDAIGMGSGNYLAGDSSFVFGYNSNSDTSAHLGVALGANASVQGRKSTSLGGYVTGENGLSMMGYSSGVNATAVRGNAIGESSIAFRGTSKGKNAVSIGPFAIANGYSSTATGINNDTLVTPQTAISTTTPLFYVGNGTINDPNLSNALVIRKDGNVGMGDINPQFRLHISNNQSGNNFFRGIMIENVSPAEVAGEPAIAFKTARLGTANYWIKGINQLSPSIAWCYGNSLSASFTRMVLDTSGRLGLATGSPAFRMQVSNNDSGGGGWTQGVMIQNTSTLANVGEAAMSFRNNALSTGKYLIFGLNESPKLSFHYGSDFDNAVPELELDTSGNVGINTNTPGFLLEVNGTAAKPGGGNWSAPSDRRLKNVITPFRSGLSCAREIKPVAYHYNEASGYATDEEYIGVIAQELQTIAPYMVSEQQQGVDQEASRYLQVDPSAMTYVLINTLKEQQQQIENLKKKIASSIRSNSSK